MGRGFKFTGSSTPYTAASPLFSADAGPSRTLPARNSVAAICSEIKRCSQSIGDSVFGSVPSRAEVERAILDLIRFMHVLSTSKLKLDESNRGQIPGFDLFCNAFYMMQNEPALQNMVASISSDKAVWEAVLSNKAVQDLRGSVSAAKEDKLPSSSEEPDIAMLILSWIKSFTKLKILELVEKFLLLVNEIFQPAPKEKPTSDLTDLLEEKVRSSLLLSVVIILIVVVTRIQG